MIHNSSIIDKKAKIGKNVKVGPFCYIGPHVQISDGVELISNIYIEGNTKIGIGTKIFPFASIGTKPQDLKYKGEANTLEIGENNTIREYVTINPGTSGGGGKTIIGNNCLLMISSHVAHDCQIGNGVTLVNNATLGGGVKLGDACILSAFVAVLQGVEIGKLVMVGASQAIRKDILPYLMVVSSDKIFVRGVNLIGLKRAGYSKEEIDTIQRIYKKIFKCDKLMKESMDDLLMEDCQICASFVDFYQRSKHGILR